MLGWQYADLFILTAVGVLSLLILRAKRCGHRHRLALLHDAIASMHQLFSRIHTVRPSSTSKVPASTTQRRTAPRRADRQACDHLGSLNRNRQFVTHPCRDQRSLKQASCWLGTYFCGNACMRMERTSSLSPLLSPSRDRYSSVIEQLVYLELYRVGQGHRAAPRHRYV
jgi:hypothetical protein